MNEKVNQFNVYVSNGILANNEFGIKSIHELQTVKSMHFEKEKYAIIKQFIKDEKIESIKAFPDFDNDGSDFLDIMRFKDQDGKCYITTVYDNNNLWQDPQVIEIFPFHCDNL